MYIQYSNGTWKHANSAIRLLVYLENCICRTRISYGRHEGKTRSRLYARSIFLGSSK